MATPVRIEGAKGASFARIIAVPVPSGERVSVGQTILEVENHKVAQEIDSTVEGILHHDLQVGDLVKVGKPIAFLAAPDEDGAKWVQESRVAKLHSIPKLPGEVLQETRATKGGTPVPVAKATEISVLGHGAGNSLAATLGVAVGPVRRRADTPSFFRDKVLDLVIYEASRLLAGKRFRILNSKFARGHIVPHEKLVVGISFDEGGRLTIYAVPDADKLSLGQTQDQVADGLMRYVGRKLKIEDVATSTVTINDSSAVPLNSSVPLLPMDQCIILSLTKDAEGSFMLSITYDHRITEGLTVASFATDLVNRVRSYAAPADDAEQLKCAFCERTARMEAAEFGRRGLLRISSADGAERWCCATCWENW